MERMIGRAYRGLRKFLGPYVPNILPRYVTVFGRRFTWVTADRVTYTRTAMVLPYAFLLIPFPTSAFAVFVIAGLLDFVDGLVATVQRKKYKDDPTFIDNPDYGAFIDAFCDKVWWSTTTITTLPHLSFSEMYINVAMWTVVTVLLVIEAFLGTVRVQDYFATKYDNSAERALKSVMSGKIKFALQTSGLGGLILHTEGTNHWAGFLGIALLALAIPFGIKSIYTKLRSR